MTILREQIETALPIDEAFRFVADFANSDQWDPGVVSSERLGDGPLGVGTRYRLLVRMGGRTAPMEYVTTAWEPTRRVVLKGTGSGVDAIDEIRFEPVPGGTRIDYVADIRLRSWMRPLAPFAGGALSRIARDARDGMQQALEARARWHAQAGA
jgi:dehydrogenase/reductase SDR family member 12